MAPTKSFASIDEYLALVPEDVKNRMQQIRELIHEVAPDAQEAIKYQIPTFTLGGNLIHFAAWKKHISLYPATSEMEATIPGVAERSNGKGTIQFPHSEPLPLEIVRQIIEIRLHDFTGR